MGKQITLTEAQIARAVNEGIKDFFNNMGNKIGKFADKVQNGYTPNDATGNETICDVCHNDGWNCEDMGNGMYYAEQYEGVFGNTEGALSLDELVGDLNMFLQDSGNGGQVYVTQRGRKDYDPQQSMVQTVYFEVR